jgi:hypothetical protein
MAENNNAYIGYRRAGRRPESQQDRSSAADAPLSALRGFASGVLGAPGDIESLIRMLPGLNERTVLPTSADVEKRLPMPELNRTPTGRAFTGAGQLGGGFYAGPGSPLKVIAESPQIIGRAARDFAQSVSPVNVIKPKGGNWLAGSVERAVEPMKQTVLNETGLQNLAERAGVDVSESVRARQLPEAALNKWLDQKLGKYIRNEMATPDDPIRALAERGITHAEHGIPYMRPDDIENLASVRQAQGFEPGGMGQSELARRWEDLADVAVDEPELAGNLMRLTERSPTVQENPWLAKVPPETRVHSLQNPGSARYDLGFGHLTDELRNAINPESGLPAALQWKYADLDKVTVPQAVERVAKINDWRAAQKAEADMARAMNPATQVVKEYPEQGMRWVELRKPEDTGRKVEHVVRHDPEGDIDDLMDRGFGRFVEDLEPEELPTITHQIDESMKALQDALKYEGETMGHCVGGYCPDVVEGRSKIYSLRDKKGQPHVTIEVRPGRKLTEKDLPDDVRELLSEQYADASREEFEAAVQQYVKQQAVPDEIVQIKGKGNKAPKEDYLPAVQDFVRSGSFGRVGDLGNTGLIDVTQAGPLMKALQDIYGRNMGVGMDKFNAAAEAMPDAQRFMTKDELLKFLGETPPEAKAHGGAVDGYATGGAVETAASGVGEYNPAKIQSLVDSLREEMYG